MTTKDVKTYTSTEKINELPDIAKNNKFFNNNTKELTGNKFYENLDNTAKTETKDTQKTKISYGSSAPVELVPTKSNVNQSFTPVQSAPTKSNVNQSSTPLQLTPTSSLNTNLGQSFKMDQKSNIMSGNVTRENLLKTESISKAVFNISEIQQKNKEIMNLDQKMKQSQQRAGIEKPQPTAIINNYSNSQAPRGSVNRGDPLAGIKNTMRSLPSWRVEMG